MTDLEAGYEVPLIGSVCSGVGGLDLGLITALGGGEVVWHVEYDKHPSAVLDARFPDVPNYGDVITTDWTAVRRVDWFTAGYPCQPFSHAGKRRGSKDERHLWPSVRDAISVLRPRNVLLENVAGHVSLGLDAVLADLAALGYDTRWGVVRASDAGAPHGRARVFIVASDAGSERHGRGEDGRSLGRVDIPDEGQAWQRERSRPESGDRGPAAFTDADGGTGAGDGLPERRDGESPTVAAGEAQPGRRGGAPADADDNPAGHRRAPGYPAERRAEPAQRRDDAPADARGERCERGPNLEGTRWHAAERSETRGESGISLTSWGAYEPAIRRWGAITGRSAPRPTELGRAGQPRLNPCFVEWMMGLPAGWVTDVLPRNQALKALGNGVVPQQAALAVSVLHPAVEVAA